MKTIRIGFNIDGTSEETIEEETGVDLFLHKVTDEFLLGFLVGVVAGCSLAVIISLTALRQSEIFFTTYRKDVADCKKDLADIQKQIHIETTIPEWKRQK